jgi:hypothetical protein
MSPSQVVAVIVSDETDATAPQESTTAAVDEHWLSLLA